MWILLWRPLVMAVGIGGFADAAVVAAAIHENVFSRLLMGWVLVILAFQAVISMGLIVCGVWRPLHRWAQERAAAASPSASKAA